MRVIKAKTAGFCFGVKRAVDQVYELAGKKEGAVYTYGPIIHNEEVVNDLEKKGVQVLHTKEELAALEKGTVVIRSHGVAREIYEQIQGKRLELVDATCPFVKKIHRIVKREGENGREIVIIGNATHPEVEGIKGWCVSKVTVIGNEEEAQKYETNSDKGICIVSQTTFNYKKFNKLVEILSKKRYDILVLNTICNATQERQVEAMRIASQVDVMLVIGGKHSSNTQKLYDICRKECKNTYYIQTLGDFNPECISSVRSVGITAGASTPNNIIEEVHTKCQS